MIFRRLEDDEAQKLMDYANQHGHSYEVWNAEDVVLGITNLIEIGVEDRVWTEFDLQNGEKK